MIEQVRQVFSQRRQIDRTIEKVIDYYAQEEDRLESEIGEYEITDNIEASFRKFLDVFGDGVRGGRVTEIGIWVSGFYGSGKSSFTKYLGAALDPSRKVGNRSFLELLCERFPRTEVSADLRTVAKKYPTAVVLLDLGAEQLAESAAAPVSKVLYWKVLQWAGFSKEKKTAQLEFTLDRRNQYDKFKNLYRERYKSNWLDIHNDPLIAVARAAEIVPSVLNNDFPTPDSYRTLKFEEARDVRDLAREIIDLCRRKTGCENVLILVDEAGQYVAPRGELILNLDGFARSLKELGAGKVWVVATGQQTLSEIVEKAAHNSAELNKLRDRFPISIHLDASDIREITHRRLLEKSEDGHQQLLDLFKSSGQALLTHTRLTGTSLFKGDPDSQTFAKLYPFLPQHFDLLLELIRTLARSTGGIGLRSAIRVIQDVLVDKSRVLGADGIKLVDRPFRTLATVDDFYDTLRADIAKVLPHVVAGVDRAGKITAALKPRLLGQLVDVVFDKMKLAGEAGSLLKIEEEIKDAVSEARKLWLDDPKPEQLLFPGIVDPQPKQQDLRFDVESITDERFWEQAEDRILEALSDYSERADTGHGFRHRLFAGDAARGFAFVDLCRSRYDTILMNPPFGASSRASKEYIEDRYPKTKGDLLASFIERTLQMADEHGLVGAISSRTPFFLGSFEALRTEVFGTAGHVCLLADLGEGVLEAMVETAIYVLARQKSGETESLFFRLLIDTAKGELLKQLTGECRKARASERTFVINPRHFEGLSGNPYAYWVSKHTIQVLGNHPRIEGTKGTVRVGLQTSDDFRFLRLFWEISPGSTVLGALKCTGSNIPKDCLNALSGGKSWVPYSKTDTATPWHSPILLLANWKEGGAEIKAFALMKGYSPSRNVRSESEYFRPGFSYMLRSTRLVPYLVPSAVIPTAGRAQIFPEHGQEYAVLGICASNIGSAVARFSGEMFARPKFQASMVQALPACDFPDETLTGIREHVDAEVNGRRAVVQRYEPFQEFSLPAWMQMAEGGETAWDLYSLFGRGLENRIAAAFGLGSDQLVELERDIREAVSIRERSEDIELDEADEDSANDEQELNIELISETPAEKAVGLITYAVGVAFGRWDVRIALDPTLTPRLPAPFDPLPVCPPGMLVGSDSLPAESGRIASEEWLRARPIAGTSPHAGAVVKSAIPDEEYPFRVSWDGILVDDPGLSGAQPHRDDIVRRVREVLDLVWGDKAPEVEEKVCAILAAPDLRDYFRGPAGFFQDHLKRYSKCRRKAPIYWPISTDSGSYTIWLYYPRLTDQTIYIAVNKYVDAKISEVDRMMGRIEVELASATARDATRLTDRRNETSVFLAELRHLREELLRIAALPFKPDHNDGVLINAAPFHGLFRLRHWATETEECWKKFANGEFDWSHLAHAIWPDRVREVCRKDRSVAIAHGLEELVEQQAPSPKKSRGRRKRETNQ